MKNLNLLFYLFLFTALLGTACSKDDSGDSDSNLQNHFSCKINGVAWEAPSISQPTVNQIPNGSAVLKQFEFYGTDDGSQLNITIQDYENADQGECMTSNTYYGVDHSNASANFSITIGSTTYNNSAKLTISGNSPSFEGSVRVTNCGDGKISGTFEFVVRDLLGEITHDVTDGQFTNVEYDFL